MDEGSPEDNSSESLPSIIACLWRLFRWNMIGAMMVKFVSDLFQFASPLLLNAIITFTEQPDLPTWYVY